MVRSWSRWLGSISALALALSLSLPALAQGIASRFPAQLLQEAAGAATATDLRPTYQLRGYSPADRFSGPEGIAIDSRNRILYVADTGKGRVVGFSLQGLPKFVLTLDSITAPGDLVVDDKGRLFVADKEAPTIAVVDAEGKPVGKIDLSDAGATGPPRIRGLAVDPKGRLYVGDQAGGQVLICDPEGHVLSRIGSRGERPGQLKMVEHVAVDRVGRIYVVDSLGAPVNVFDPSGKFIFRFGRISADPQDLRSPVALSIDRHDQLWVVDEDGHCLQVFDGRGFRLRTFGGDTPESLSVFLFPSGVALDGMGNIYVAERGADRVQIFRLESPFLPFRP